MMTEPLYIKGFHAMLSKLLLPLGFLALKLIECSENLGPSMLDDEQQSKNSKTGLLVPRKLPPNIEYLPHDYWLYHPFPAFQGIDEANFASVDAIHSQDDVRVFACIREGQLGGPEVFFKSTVPTKVVSSSLEVPVTSVSISGNFILLTYKKRFGIVDRTPPPDGHSSPWYHFNETTRIVRNSPQEKNVIVAGKLVSETLIYLLTGLGVLVCLNYLERTLNAPEIFSVVRRFRNVANFAAEDNLLALITTKKPRAFAVFLDNDENAFFSQRMSP